MHTENDWVASDTDAEAAYRFFMRTDPDMRDILGPIETVDDPFLGRPMRTRQAKIAMMRGMKADRPVTVYLDPTPHIRLDNAKPLLGWYGNAHPKSPRERVRPCYSEAVLTEPYGGMCPVNCQFSLLPGELIETPRGPRPIEDIQEGEPVWGRSKEGSCWAIVTGRTNHWKDEGYVELRLHDKRLLRLTADHPVYSSKRGAWVEAGKLSIGEQLENLPSLFSAKTWSPHPTVESINRVEGGVQVYDIETTTENFYHNGILSHNCYVNAGIRGYKGTGLMTVPLDYGGQVRKMLSKMRTATAGYWSSFTDPFQPLEDYYHNTQRSAEAFDELGLPVFFLSRRSYPGWAYDLLQRNKYSYMQKSVNVPDPDDWKKLSPGALSLMGHLDEIREARRRGIFVSIQVNPVIAGITTHEDVEQLFEMLAEAGANHVIVKFVEAGYAWAPAMVQRMTKAFGDNRAAAFRELFVQNIGGQKTIAEEYRMEGHRRYQKKATSLGLSYAVCFEFKAVPGTSGVSVGPEFMTSDQCHGRRVPMFTRLDTSVPFTEVEACPPSGCLTCSSDNGGAARCGNELLGAAKAMRTGDYREPVL